MGEKALVEDLLDDSIELIGHMDASGNRPTFAAWYYYVDADEWRLLIASPSLDTLLPKQEAVAYQRVIASLTSFTPSALAVSDLKIVSTSYPLVRALAFLVNTGTDGVVRAHLRNSSINGMFIKEAVILRSA